MVGYTLIFLLGTAVGAMVVRFGSQSLRQQKKDQLALKRQRDALVCYHQKLADHFLHNVALLEKCSADYRLLHQQVTDYRLPGNSQYHTCFTEPVIEAVEKEQIGNDAVLIDPVQPCDYASVPSGLLRSQKQDQGN